jgi:hypothetical protein
VFFDQNLCKTPIIFYRWNGVFPLTDVTLVTNITYPKDLVVMGFLAFSPLGGTGGV